MMVGFRRSKASGSMQLQLLAWTLTFVGAVWLVLSVVAWREAESEAEELFDAHLAQTAALLVVLSSEESGDLPEELPSHRYARKVAFQIWSDKGKLLARSTTAPREQLTDQSKGFSDRRIDGRHWRIYSKQDERHHHRILVAETYEARNAVGKELAKHLLTPLIFALPTLAVGLILLMRSRFRPLQRLASSIGQRSPDRLDPITLEAVPREVQPIIEQINRLMQRVSDSIEQERRFTADAAHEIRTPLAAIRTYAQVAEAATESGEQKRALASVIQATDRATHLLGQLLTMARLDNDALTNQFVACDLRKIAVGVIADITPHALESDVECMLDEGVPAWVRGEPALLTVLLRNLIDNAIRYSPRGTFVAVTIKRVEGRVKLTVSDQGPGIPEAERERVLSRFTRLAGNAAPGSGLGLSIALRIAQIHGATLSLQDGPGEYGLSACVAFPEVAAPGDAALPGTQGA
jgi:two-component system sensor histidine kinase QseC